MQLVSVKYRQPKPLPPRLWFHNLITLLGMWQCCCPTQAAQLGPRSQPTPRADVPREPTRGPHCRFHGGCQEAQAGFRGFGGCWEDLAARFLVLERATQSWFWNAPLLLRHYTIISPPPQAPLI